MNHNQLNISLRNGIADSSQPTDQDELQSQLGPAYYYIVNPMKRIPPFTRQLKRAILRHRLLFHYYSRPVFRYRDGIDYRGRYFFLKYGGGAVTPQQCVAEKVWQWKHSVEDELKLLDEYDKPGLVVSHNTGSNFSSNPQTQAKNIFLGWLIHPIGKNVLESSHKDIEELVDLLCTLDPDEDQETALNKVRYIARVSPIPVYGWGGEPLVPYHNSVDMCRAVDGLNIVSTLEIEASLAGWRPQTKQKTTNPSDPSSYVSAKDVLAKHSDLEVAKTHKDLAEKILPKHPEIRRWHPRPNRLMIHLVDWLDYCERVKKDLLMKEKAWDDSLDIEKRKAAIKKTKYQ